MINIDYKTAIVGGLFVAGAVWFIKREVKAIAPDVVENVDPVNPDNIFNRAANSLFRTVTGSKKDIGTAIYDFTHKTK